jgi:hypothetical protein
LTIGEKIDGGINYFKGGGFRSDVGAATSRASAAAGRLGDQIKQGGLSTLDSIKGRVINIDTSPGAGTHKSAESDWRVRVSPAPATSEIISFKSIFMTPLAETNGVIFPYTPQITMQHNAKYGVESLTHSNYSTVFYQSSDVGAITVQGDFSVQNIEEGRYLFAAIHFFRTCTKMFFGQDRIAGTPPPLLFLNGYGAPYLPNVPCVITNFNHTMPGDVDYVEVEFSETRTVKPKYDWSGGPVNDTVVKTNHSVRLPTLSQISITLQPVYSRSNIHKNFGLEKYAQGDLVQVPGSNQGGFI